MKRMIKTILLGALIALSLTGCKTRFGSIPNEQEVMDKVFKSIEKEKFELVGKEKVDTRPRKCIYTFKSIDRNFEFQAISTLERQRFLGGNSLCYKGFVDVNNYSDVVKALYKQEMIDELKKTGIYEEKREGFLIHNNEEYAIVWEALYEADQIYANEKEYNSEEWMKKNPAIMVELDFIIDGKAYSGSKICLTGIMSKEEIKQEIERIKAYAGKFMHSLDVDDTNIVYKTIDGSIPDEQYDAVLEALYLADQTYAAESEYHSEEWIKEHPLMKVRLDFLINDERHIGGFIWITGGKTKDDIREEMERNKGYAEKREN